MPFYKILLGKKLTIIDMETMDNQFYQSLKWVRENEIDGCGLDLYFAIHTLHTRVTFWSVSNT